MAKTAKTIIFAIGNPGKEYEHTYHNAGVLVLEYMLEHGAEHAERKNYKKLFAYAEIGDAVFVRSLVYMNESGKAAREALKKFAAKPKDLVLVHDDSDIMLGNFKISFARNSAGHKGVQSIIDVLGTNQFTRARVGIRPAPRPERKTKREKAGEFALKTITPGHRKILEGVFGKLAEELKKTYDE